MSCSPYNLKDYFLDELGPSDRAAVEQHVAVCQACQNELSALNVTRAALLSVTEEEPPRRIAFVSDKVFEPRWWQKVWHSGPQLGFASAAMLSLALFAHAFVPRTEVAPAPTATLQPAAIEKMVQAEVARRLDSAVKQAVTEIEDRQASKLLSVVDSRFKASEQKRREDLRYVTEVFERVMKRQGMVRRTAFDGATYQ